MDLCDECLGRLFLNVEGKSNKERGEKMRKILGMEKHDMCELCENVFEKLDDFAKKIARELNNYEFDTFLVGTHVPERIIIREEKAWSEYGIENTETIKKNVNRELGKILEKITGKKHSERPDIEIVVNPWDEKFDIRPNPIYIYGRYRKYAEMPQTKWPCRYCGGTGCEKCEYTGRQWRETVEYIIADIALGLTLGKETKLHAAGREDIDAKMLGTGRPFVLEIVRPRKRKIDLDLLKNEVNAHGKGKIEVLCFLPSCRKEVVELKNARYDKVYRLVMHVEKKENLKKIEELSGKIIVQRTPTRILHRKGEQVRKRKVKKVRVISEDPAVVEIVAESGLYIKELATGDGGRTSPSFADFVGSVEVVGLEIIGIEGGREC